MFQYQKFYKGVHYTCPDVEPIKHLTNLQKLPVFDTPPLYFNEYNDNWPKFCNLVTSSASWDLVYLKKLDRGLQYLKLDKDKDKILETFNLRTETEDQQKQREALFSNVGYHCKRPMNKPFYFVNLQRKQYRKLFKDPPAKAPPIVKKKSITQVKDVLQNNNFGIGLRKLTTIKLKKKSSRT